MSSQRGNTSRTRAQKHKNSFGFKNDLHDKTPKVKLINSLNVCNVCERCKSIIEWKIKYKKYKPLSAPKTCTKCQQKTIKHAYHIMCQPCGNKFAVCPRCGQDKAIESQAVSKEEQAKQDRELQELIKSLPERKRRTFLRYMEKRKNDDGESEDKSELIEKLNVLKLESGKDDTDSWGDSDSTLHDSCSDDEEDV